MLLRQPGTWSQLPRQVVRPHATNIPSPTLISHVDRKATDLSSHAYTPTVTSGCLTQKRAESVVDPKLQVSSTSINPSTNPTDRQDTAPPGQRLRCTSDILPRLRHPSMRLRAFHAAILVEYGTCVMSPTFPHPRHREPVELHRLSAREIWGNVIVGKKSQLGSEYIGTRGGKDAVISARNEA